QKRFAHLQPVHTSNFMPQVDAERCTGCGKCVDACPVDALALVSADDPQRPRRRAARLDESVCLGCGVCVRACARGDIALVPRAARVITPVNNAHRYVLMAAERGTLQDLIFDNRVLWHHRALAALLGAVLKLPPLKRALASEQMKSRYLEAVTARQTP
ncbi:MAG TPA: 4Fe-4S binding protein, partial [Candidatus Krumholzibacteria bacterium]|nr:4Fe-4S binding protein [Candidatus Krumholzibacteria bacterium]